MKWCPQCRSVHERTYRPDPLLYGFTLGGDFPDIFCHIAAAWYPAVIDREEERRAVYWEASTRMKPKSPGEYHGICRNCFKVMHLSTPATGFETCCNSGEER